MNHGHDDTERVFAALPPARGRAFARTWWGRAWLKALEDTALDGEQLKRGRRHARAGAVGAVSVRPGRVTAVVRDPDGTARRSDVLWRPLGEGEWERFLDMAADRAGHVAALLDQEMPPHLVEDAADAGIDLLPGIGDLDAECACGAWDHCPHSAALCYQVARLLDEDPFVLLLLRGRGEPRLLAELQARSAGRATAPAGATEPDVARPGDPAGVPVAAAFARDASPAPLPAPPGLPAGPGQPPALATGTAPPPEVDVDALELLAADAAGRALRLLSEALSPGHERTPVESDLSSRQDAVRLAATSGARLTSALAARLAAGSGREPADLDLAVRAWNHGGAAALAVLEEEEPPLGPEALTRARASLGAAWEEVTAGAGRADAWAESGSGRWTLAGAPFQLRLGHDGRWWPYREEHGRWAPAGAGGPDPATVLAEWAGSAGSTEQRTLTEPTEPVPPTERS
ncbi:hypothetical protein [Streptomyces sp. NRRL F-5135]|uniref:hypothetical protein n=1 Tax=Streptomyces sp. NRRL F-5135 TaxID=1463858 RepID=UPI0007C58D89|nr:hypothetical protein [Streptomyces sp. NRRL F-5135]